MTLQVTSDVSDRARHIAHYLSHEARTLEGCADLRAKVSEAAALLSLQDAELSYLRLRLSLTNGEG